MNNCNCNEPACHEPCKIYPFAGVNYTAEEINRLLGEIDKKASANNFRDGLSSYEVAVKNGYKGTEEEWLASLRGPRGEALQFEDLTQDELDILKEPATKAGEEVKEQTDNAIKNVNEVTAKAIQETELAAEEARKQAEIAGQSALETQKQGDIAEQKGNEADNKASEAESAAIRANEAADRVTNDGLFKTPQDLSEEEQAQVKRNIGIQDFIAGLTTLPIADFSDKVNATTATKTVDNIIPKEISFLIVDIGVVEGDSSLPANPELSAVLCPVSGGGRVVFQGTASTKFENFKISVISGSAENDGMGVEVSTPRSITYKVFQVRYLTETDSASFKGSFNSSGILQSAYPTAKPGDYAYVGNPRHLYEWDSSAWQDRGLYITDVDQALNSVSGKAIANKAVTAKLTELADTQTTQGEEIEKINAEAVFSDANTEELPQPEQTSSDYATSALQDWEGNNIYDYYATKAQLADIKPVVINGNVTNNADNEDLEAFVNPETSNGVMRLKDRLYAPGTFSGKGYKILRRNIVTEKRSSSNILTQDMLSDSNTVYEIRYDFDLGGAEITIPRGSTLNFKGGTFKNGTIVLNNTNIVAEGHDYIFIDIVVKGFTTTPCYVDWFGAFPYAGEQESPQDSSDAIQAAFDSAFYIVKFNIGLYYINKTVTLKTVKSILMEGVQSTSLYSVYNKPYNRSIIAGTRITTQNNIDIIRIAIERYRDFDYNNTTALSIIGGVFDVSKIDYDKTVIKFVGKNCGVWNLVVKTVIIGSLLRELEKKISDINADNKGIGIGFVQEGSGTQAGSFYIADIDSYIEGFTYGIKNEMNNVYITSFDFRGIIDACKVHIDLGDGIQRSRIFTTFQPRGIFKEGDASYFITGRLRNTYIDGVFWDINLKSYTDGYTTKYICNIVPDDNVVFSPNCLQYLNYNVTGYKYAVNKIYNDALVFTHGLTTFGNQRKAHLGLLDNVLHFHKDFTIETEGSITVDDYGAYANPFNSAGMVISPKKNINGSNLIFTITNIPNNVLSKFIVSIPLRYSSEMGNATFEEIEIVYYNNDTVVKSETFENVVSDTHWQYYFAIMDNTEFASNVTKVVVKLKNLIMTDSHIGKACAVRFEASSTYNNLRQIGTREYTEIRKDGRFILHGNELQYFVDDYSHFLWNRTTKERFYSTFGMERFFDLEKIKENINSGKILYGSGARFHFTNGVKAQPLFYDKSINRLFDAMGNPAECKKQGTFAEKPTSGQGIDVGFQYFCTDKQSSEASEPGMMIYHRGSNVWVDALGRVIS